MKKAILFLSGCLFILNVFAQGKFTDPRDKNVYKTVTVNNKVWMAENIRYKVKDGAALFDNNPNNVSSYGYLYSWSTALKVCPDGWHLPTGAEFEALVDHFNQKEGWKGELSDTTSFGIQLAGMQDFEGTFSEMDQSAYFWTSTEYDKENAEYFSYIVYVNTAVTDISRKADIADIHGTEKISKYSVRCVKN